jgi:hypothetical protein
MARRSRRASLRSKAHPSQRAGFGVRIIALRAPISVPALEKRKNRHMPVTMARLMKAFASFWVLAIEALEFAAVGYNGMKSCGKMCESEVRVPPSP